MVYSMTILLLSFNDVMGGIGDVLIFIVCAIIIIAIAIPYLKVALYAILFIVGLINGSHNRSKFEKQANLLAPRVKEALNKLEDYFSPQRRVEQIDVDAFLSEYRELINEVNNLHSSETEMIMFSEKLLLRLSKKP